MEQKTQAELAAIYHEQQTIEGRRQLQAEKENALAEYKETGVYIPVLEVGLIVNDKTGKQRYFIKA